VATEISNRNRSAGDEQAATTRRKAPAAETLGSWSMAHLCREESTAYSGNGRPPR
jgi:hypothetical protein